MRGFISSACEFAAWDFRVVGGLYCLCDGNPPALAEFSSRDDRREAARAHPGTCGVAQADVIAGVETEAVEQTAAGRQQEASYRTFRNQVRYRKRICRERRIEG